MRALVAIASYGRNNDHYLAQLVAEYQSMSFPVDIVTFSNAPKDVAPGVAVVVVDLANTDPWSLPFPHKQFFADRVAQYDLFVYSEDDTLVTEKNLQAFLELSATLPEGEIPGFLRFEKGPDGSVNLPEIHGHFHWDPRSVRERGGEKFAFFTNEHAACYALTREQLKRSVKSGGYLVGAHKGKYDLLCTAATDPYTQCGMEKLICISRVDDLLIHHLPNKYVGSSFGIDGPEFRRQLVTLMNMNSNGCKPATLFPTETKLPACAFSKNYYETARPEILSCIPAETRKVLSIGCGTGALEGVLKQRGAQVVALPLDPVIPGEALAREVELVTGSLEEAFERLANRRFDCLLLSNVLHLVPEPQKLLRNFGQLLAKDATIIVLTPNLSKAQMFLERVRGNATLSRMTSYETSGVHLTSPGSVRKWLKRSGMRLQKRIDILSPHRQELDRRSFGMFRPLLAEEFLAVARKD
jgi:2-polyprenyl-3-methyl-5-hydroxy-6-metoxy-1,4-benzoquinol methylase